MVKRPRRRTWTERYDEDVSLGGISQSKSPSVCLPDVRWEFRYHHEGRSRMVSDGEAPDDEVGEEQKHRRQAEEMHARWLAGEAKSQLEITYWGDGTSHGKRFTSYVRRWLGVETERRSEQTERIRHLEALLRVNGIAPTDAGDLAEEHRLVAKARESALAAVRVYNDPAAGFRSETFIVLMVIAWNSLFQAILERDGVDYYVRGADGKQVSIDDRAKVLSTGELAARAVGGDGRQARGIRANLDFFLGLRHQIAHGGGHPPV